MFFGWFSTVIGENQKGMYNLAVDRSFRMGMIWFIFSEVMFFAAFFGALFYARAVLGAVARRRGHQGVQQADAVAGLHRRLAEQRPGAAQPARRRQLRGHSGLRPAGDQHADPADLRRDDHHRAPCAEGRQTRHAERVPGGHLPARLPVRVPAGQRIRRGLHREGPAAGHRHLRLNLLHADRLPRLPRDAGRHHADGDLAALPCAVTSRRSGTSPSRPWPGTGTSSTWCGSACSCSSTGSEQRRGPRAR